MALQPWRKGNVIRIEDHTHNTKRYWIEVAEMDNFDFKPGQFVTLDLPIHEKPNKRVRSYSISSWPDGSNVFELLIVLAPHGLGTHHIFNEWQIGSEITFRGPQGVFTLPEDRDREIIFVCTGTGIAPFRSMVNYIALHNLPFKRIDLVFGCRYRRDLLYFEEMKALEKDLPGFYYHPTLSREEWEGSKGYVHPVYEEISRGRPDALFFLCGWKAMIDEARQRIHDLGYDRKAVHLELYG